MNDDLNQVTQRIDDDMTLSSFGFLTPVKPSIFTGQDGLNTL